MHLLDRKKDVIISGGFNIYAIDLERVLLSHGDVLDAAVIAAPSEQWGETPLAFVVGRMEMDFLAPARIDDCLPVETVFTQFRGARLLAEHAISRQTASGDSEPIWQAHVLAACVDLQGRAKRMPKTMLADLTPYQGTAILAPPK